MSTPKKLRVKVYLRVPVLVEATSKAAIREMVAELRRGINGSFTSTGDDGTSTGRVLTRQIKEEKQ